MPNQSLPEHLRRRLQVDTVDEMWYKLLTEGNVRWKHLRHIFGRLPSNPRCVNCHRPFAGIGGALLRITQGVHKSAKNPRFCAGCYSMTEQFPGGAEVVLTMLFVDVRGSTTLAEKMNAAEFGRLMNRFYEAAINVLVQADAFIDKMKSRPCLSQALRVRSTPAGRWRPAKPCCELLAIKISMARGSRLALESIPAWPGSDQSWARVGPPPISRR